MEEQQKLRIYADLASETTDGWCWILRHGDHRLDEVAKDLGPFEGMPVIIYYSDPGDEFEYDAILSYRTAGPPSLGHHWIAKLDKQTFRRIRG